MLDVGIKLAKTRFFDRQAVQRAVAAGTRKALSRAGAFVRARARQLIRRRKGYSRPGQPPHSHVGLLKDHIYFVYDQQSQSVVIGPALLGRRVQRGPTVPQVLEFGGSVERLRGRAYYEARPYMSRALREVRHQIVDQFRDVIAGGR